MGDIVHLAIIVAKSIVFPLAQLNATAGRVVSRDLRAASCGRAYATTLAMWIAATGIRARLGIDAATNSAFQTMGRLNVPTIDIARLAGCAAY
jgi:hypothetical protein